MLLDSPAASRLVDAAAAAVASSPRGFGPMLDPLPAPIYVTGIDGTLTYFNPACVPLAGRVPECGRDRYCVTWRLYTDQGEFLPHDQCPMAVALRERRPVRNVEAIAERPDGTTVNFTPFPTPVFDSAGAIIGAVNLLLDITARRGADYFSDQAAKCRRLARAVTDPAAIGTLRAMAERYSARAASLSRPN